MKKTFVLFIVACGLLVTSLPASARYRDHYRGHHHDNGAAGVAVGVLGGLILGGALNQYPPTTVVYPPPQTVVYPQTQVVVQQPRVCVEDRTVSGEWQMSRFDGKKVWVEFAYPRNVQVQVPCY